MPASGPGPPTTTRPMTPTWGPWIRIDAAEVTARAIGEIECRLVDPRPDLQHRDQRAAARRRGGSLMPDIARLDEHGVLVAVETVSAARPSDRSAGAHRRPAGRARHGPAARRLPLRLHRRLLPAGLDRAAGRRRARGAGPGRGAGRVRRGRRAGARASTCRPGPRRRSPPGGGRSTAAGGRR